MAKKTNQTNATAKFWVRLVCGFLGFLMVFGVLVMAISVLPSSASELPAITTQPDQQISVGLYCNETAVQSYTLNADNGFQVRFTSDSEPIQLDSSTLTVAVDANLYKAGDSLYTESIGIATVGGYHIQVSQFSFSDLIIDENHDNPVYIDSKNTAGTTNGYTTENVNEYIELLNMNEKFKALSWQVFPYYSTDNVCYIRIGSFYTEAEALTAMNLLTDTITAQCEVVGPNEKTVSFLNQDYSILCEGTYTSSDKYLTISPLEAEQFTDRDGKQYRGSIWISRTSASYSKALTVVNHVSLETYVSLILSSEVSAKWNDELLKSMAVLLRTKITKQLGCHQSDGFDICSNSHCHIYYGNAPLDEKIVAVVNETAGQILTYEGNPIYTPYSVYNGGSTVSSKDAFGTTIPYLDAIYTPWENIDHWTVEFTPYELFQILSSAGYEEIKGNVSSVQVLGRAPGSDYVNELKITDIFGSAVTIYGSENIRILFGGKLPSACFYTGKAGDTITVVHRELTDGIRYSETNRDVLLEGTYGNFVFIGSGEGCGVGFSIRGGLILAEMGMTYDQILSIYFPNTQLNIDE